LNAKKLLEDGQIIIKRNEDGEMVPYNYSIQKLSSEEVNIRFGQLNADSKLHGIGRKIHL